MWLKILEGRLRENSMTSQERDSVGESLERVERGINLLAELVENRAYSQPQEGSILRPLAEVTLQILTSQHEALVLIESNLDDRLRKIENLLDQKP